MKALIFDCDGVLVDTERDGHRVAFNESFAEFGLKDRWDIGYYGILLQVAGGKERMRHHFETHTWPARAGDDHDAFVAELHKRKTAIFTGIIAEGKLPLRSGIVRIVDEAVAAGVRLGVCTTSNPKSVDGVLDLMGPERKARFEFVLAGDVVKNKKPAPEIYNLAQTKLNLPPSECVVIEDSRNGMLAALGANMPCLITTSTYTTGEDFSGSLKIVPELGDGADTLITLNDLAALASEHRA